MGGAAGSWKICHCCKFPFKRFIGRNSLGCPDSPLHVRGMWRLNNLIMRNCYLQRYWFKTPMTGRNANLQQIFSEMFKLICTSSFFRKKMNSVHSIDEDSVFLFTRFLFYKAEKETQVSLNLLHGPGPGHTGGCCLWGSLKSCWGILPHMKKQ